MDTSTIWTIIGTAGTVLGLVYAFMRNFKSDINSHIDKMGGKIVELTKEMKEENRRMEKRIVETNQRMDGVYNVLLSKSGMKNESS